MKYARFGIILLLLVLVPAVTVAQGDCPAPRLEVGGRGQVAPGASNRIRSEPSTSGQQVGQIPAGGVFEVLAGPECAGGFLWWQVNYQGTVGWTVEGSAGEYFVDPVVREATAMPQPTASGDAVCSLPPRLQVGREGKTTSNTPSRLRDNPGTSGRQIGQINPLSTFQIMEGPVCADGIHWWQVQASGTTGWTAEGVDGEYLIELVEILPTPTPAYIGLRGARAIGWSGDGSLLAVGTADGVYVFDTADFTQPPTQVLAGYQVSDLAFDPREAARLAVTQDDGDNYSAQVYNLESGETALALVGERPVMSPNSLAYTADGTRMAFNNGGTLITVDAETGSPDFQLMLKDFSGGQLAYMGALRLTISPDGKWMGVYDGRVLLVPVGGRDRDVMVLDRGTLETSVTALAFSPDSQRFIVGDAVGNLQMWDVTTQQRTSFIRGARSTTSNRVYALAFSPDGKTVVTAEGDPTAVVRVFKVEGLSLVTTFSDGANAENAWGLAFNPEGTRLAVIFDDTVRILDTQDYSQTAELVLQRN